MRIYADDVAERLREAFHTVERLDYAATFRAPERSRMGLVEPSRWRGEDIYVCSGGARILLDAHAKEAVGDVTH